MKQTQNDFLHLAHKLQEQTGVPNPKPLINNLHLSARKETTYHMRDGEVLKIAASTVPTFKAGAAFKAAVNKKK